MQPPSTYGTEARDRARQVTLPFTLGDDFTCSLKLDKLKKYIH